MKRALVLGGGGPVGIAWEAGLLAGLLEGGVDVREADYVLGTSAGSFVGSQVAAGRDMRKTVEAILAEADRQPSSQPTGAAKSKEERPAGPSSMMTLMRLMQEAADGKRPAQEVRVELGTFALAAKTVDEETFIKSFGRSLAGSGEGAWPKRHFACTAVDTATGDFQVWDNDSGVSLAKAVASSCSVPGVYPPISINGKRWMDGGMRSGVNADLAVGHDKVMVVAVRLGGGDAQATERSRLSLEAELQVLRNDGAQVGLIVPDEASTKAFGPNLMDPRARPAAARAGYEQGLKLAPKAKQEWT